MYVHNFTHIKSKYFPVKNVEVETKKKLLFYILQLIQKPAIKN